MKTHQHSSKRTNRRAVAAVAAFASVAAMAVAAASSSSAATVSAWGGPPGAYFVKDSKGDRVMLQAKAVAGVPKKDFLTNVGTYHVNADQGPVAQDVVATFKLQQATPSATPSWSTVGPVEKQVLSLDDGQGGSQGKTVDGPTFQVRHRGGSDARLYRVVADFKWVARSDHQRTISEEQLTASQASELHCSGGGAFGCFAFEFEDGSHTAALLLL